MYTLCTLERLRQWLGLVDEDTADDARLREALAQAAAQIERAAGRRFSPRRAALPHTAAGVIELLLDDDLLELLALTNGDGRLIPLENVQLLPAEGPAGLLRLTSGAAFTWGETRLNAVTVTGIWGWHDRWDEAWRDSGDSVQGGLDADAGVLAVSDADGADAAGEQPRFQAGQLLKIADEYLRVLAVDTAANTLAVERGANGTEAASHPADAAIYIYQPPADVAALALRRAAWLVRSADHPEAPPDDLNAALAGLRRTGVKV